MDKKTLMKRFDIRCVVEKYLNNLLMQDLVVGRDLEEAKLWTSNVSVIEKQIEDYDVFIYKSNNYYVVDGQSFYFSFYKFKLISQGILRDEELRADEWLF